MKVLSLLERGTERRRAAAAVMVVVFLPVLVGFAALVIDVGVMYNTRADLQNAADAAALAGATALASDEMTQLRLANSGVTGGTVSDMSVGRAGEISYLNPSWGTVATSLEHSDITVGQLDLSSAGSHIASGVVPSTFNAVQVVTRRSADGENGPVQLIFARVFGKETTQISASAVAAFDDRAGGYDMNRLPGAWPITISQTAFEAGFTPGVGDDDGEEDDDDDDDDGPGSHDDDDDDHGSGDRSDHGAHSDDHGSAAGEGSDESEDSVAWVEWNGMTVLRIYPSAQSGASGAEDDSDDDSDDDDDDDDDHDSGRSSHGDDDDDDDDHGSRDSGGHDDSDDEGSAPGNFGLLNIGTGNQGVPGLRVQFEDGVSADDYETEVDTSVLTFQGSEGASSYAITGSPGLDASLESSMNTRVGEVVGFFLHSSVSGQGANATYDITGVRYGRVLSVNLQGPASQRGVLIQPVAMVSDGIILSSSAASTNGMTGRIVLAR